ncbi:MAG: SsrA-binding protein, partial [Rhodospirillaceae bacterium]|nr:SsrA-binding protein [Rhodospirillaceae bacterium]
GSSSSVSCSPNWAGRSADGVAKLDLGLARGKKQHDKRETDKRRDWQREKARLMREKG